jgi:hypothetical protein
VVEAGGGGVVFVALTLPPAEQERRLVDPGRAAFGKMRSVALLRSLRDAFDASAAAMPAPRLTIDTAVATPEAAAEAIAAALAG